ncbi:MAG: hypothetical protein R6V58_00510 [Planctomycetota bacterium]
MNGEAEQELDRRRARRLTLAGAAAGIAAGGCLVSLMVRAEQITQWRVEAYEPAAALLGALGIWAFGPSDAWERGWLGVGAAIGAMWLGDLLRVLSATPFEEWLGTAGALMRPGSPTQRRVAELFRPHPWIKLLRYGFGAYIGWYAGSAGRDGGRAEPAAESEDRK